MIWIAIPEGKGRRRRRRRKRRDVFDFSLIIKKAYLKKERDIFLPCFPLAPFDMSNDGKSE
jgi:hypothetical protein